MKQLASYVASYCSFQKDTHDTNVAATFIRLWLYMYVRMYYAYMDPKMYAM